MRNTNKGKNMLRNLSGKVIATSLALAMSVSVLGFNTKSASAAAIETDVNKTVETETDFYETTDKLLNRITDEDLEALKKIGIETLMEIFGSAVPGGGIMKPALSAFLGASILGHETSLDDINNNINGLYDRIDQFEKDMKDELRNIITLENFDYGPFSSLNSMINGISKSIKNAQDNNTVKQQLAIIGAQIGKDLEWKKGDSPFVKFTSVTDKINKANLVGSQDLFKTVYDYFAQRSMFSGEAIDKSRAVLDGIMKYYMSAYTVLLECLTAQLAVNQLENTDGIDPYYLDNISTNVPEIKQKIEDLNKVVLGVVANGCLDKTGTVSEKYTNIINMDRMILVDKNKANDRVSGQFTVTNHQWLNNANKDCAVSSFKETALRSGRLSYGKVKDIAEYAKSKGMTVRQLLEANGFDTSRVPKNANLVTSDPYDDLGVVDFLTGLAGSVHLHGLYKGINIDEKNPSEKEIRMWNDGCNGYFFADSWDFFEPGYAVTIDLR